MQFFNQGLFKQDLIGAAADDFELFFDGFHNGSIGWLFPLPARAAGRRPCKGNKKLYKIPAPERFLKLKAGRRPNQAQYNAATGHRHAQSGKQRFVGEALTDSLLLTTLQ